MKFIQYKLPYGTPVEGFFDMPEDIEKMADEIIKEGYRFEIEKLSTGEIHLDCCRDDIILANALSQNGPEVLEKVKAVVQTAYKRLYHIPFIPLAECKNRKAYKIKSRNLKFGVFNKETNGFLGLRTKWGDVYLFEEYHWDTGIPYGTVHPITELEETLPEDIRLCEDLGTECSECKRLVAFDIENKQWYHLDDNSLLKEGITACSISNKALFNWLKDLEAKYGDCPL